jgi:restriction endonuclease Mrr
MVSIPGRKSQAYAHRVAWELTNGPIAGGLVIDHRPTCPKNCVNPEHLRVVTRKQNSENRAGAQVNSSSGVRGVYWHKRADRWEVKVKHLGKQYYGGLFQTKEGAEEAAVRLRNSLFTHNDLDRDVS